MEAETTRLLRSTAASVSRMRLAMYVPSRKVAVPRKPVVRTIVSRAKEVVGAAEVVLVSIGPRDRFRDAVRQKRLRLTQISNKQAEIRGVASSQ
jgi:hypothetical protein